MWSKIGVADTIYTYLREVYEIENVFKVEKKDIFSLGITS